MDQSAKSLGTGGGLLLAVAIHLALMPATLDAQPPQNPLGPSAAWGFPSQSGSRWITRTAQQQVESPPKSYPHPMQEPALRHPSQGWPDSTITENHAEVLDSGTAPYRPLRHMGLGQPLQGTSWLNRPHFVGVFAGSWIGGSRLAEQVEQDTGLFTGYWLGSDLDHYWGCELRLSLFYVDIQYLPDGIQGGSTRNVVGDVNFLYYPWGDSRWRPYGSLGLGVSGFHFIDRDNVAVNHSGVELPIGLGVKYLSRHWLAMRFDVKDNIVFGGNDVKTTSNWSLTGGVEIHWGGDSSARYYPW